MVTTAPDKLSTAAYLEQWLDGSARSSLRPRTFAGYQAIVRRHLVPGLGRIPLAKLTAAHVQQLLSGLEGAPQTVRNIHAVLRRALGQAVRWGILSRNVATLVDLPAARPYDVRAIDVDDARGSMTSATARPRCCSPKASILAS